MVDLRSCSSSSIENFPDDVTLRGEQWPSECFGMVCKTRDKIDTLDWLDWMEGNDGQQCDVWAR